MNLYLITRTDEVDYDEFDEILVVAKSEDIAIDIHPDYPNSYNQIYKTWTTKENLSIKLIGTTKLYKETEVIMSSFKAG